MGGQRAAQNIIENLLEKSLFVEEAERNLKTLILNYSDKIRGTISLESIKNLFLSMMQNLDELVTELYALYSEWLDVCRENWKGFDLTSALSIDSRFASINELIETGPPDSDWDKLLWAHHLIVASCPLAKILDHPGVFTNDITLLRDLLYVMKPDHDWDIKKDEKVDRNGFSVQYDCINTR